MAGSSDVAAIELDDETNDLTVFETGGVSRRVAASAWLARWKDTRPGRTLLGLAQWAVVVALVLTGYFAAAGINAGVEHLSRNSTTNTSPAETPPTILAAAHD